MAARGDVLARVRVVLVEPKSPGNVGSVARACMNAGLAGLDLVGELPWRDSLSWMEEAQRMARHAAPLLLSMGRYADLASALGGSAFVAGTSVRPTGAQRLSTPRQAAAEICARAEEGSVALVFGREDRGLSVEELAHCDLRITIPSSEVYAAWNLAQAVAIVAAALREEVADGIRPQRPLPEADLAPASHATLERMYGMLEALLLEVGYLDPNNPARIMADMRRVLGSRGLSERDARLIMGALHQIAWALHAHGGKPSPDEPW